MTECLLGMPISSLEPWSSCSPKKRAQQLRSNTMPNVHTIIWAAAASAMNFHTRPADFASNVVNSPWGMQITGFPPSQQDGSSHGGSTMRESSLKHICDSIFCPSAMRNPQRRSHVSRRPAARPRRSPQTCSAVILLDCNFYFFITM